VEIETRKGFAYAQLTHKLLSFGALLRVFEGFHRARPSSFEMVVRGPVQFETFFPLDTAVRRKIVKIVGREPVSEPTEFPLFRAAQAIDPKTNRILNWWLWDGEREWPLDRPLTEDERRLSIRAVVNDTALVDRIETGWRAEDRV
jgi:hypothetical protein